MEYLFRILRYNPEQDEMPYFQDYTVETNEKNAILDALMEIRNEQDEGLAFRYSCREAVCGSCGMVVNGEIVLACRTLLESLGSKLVVIEPMPNFEILKDLIVDMQPFWEALDKIRPYVHSNEHPAGDGYRIEESEMEKIQQYITCIMCGCCYAACPVVSRDQSYYGPAALAKLYRLVADPRDKRSYEELFEVNTENAAWGCDTIFRCNEVCPKEVRPADGIEALRRKLVFEKFKRIFRLKR